MAAHTLEDTVIADTAKYSESSAVLHLDCLFSYGFHFVIVIKFMLAKIDQNRRPLRHKGFMAATGKSILWNMLLREQQNFTSKL